MDVDRAVLRSCTKAEKPSGPMTSAADYGRLRRGLPRRHELAPWNEWRRVYAKKRVHGQALALHRRVQVERARREIARAAPFLEYEIRTVEKSLLREVNHEHALGVCATDRI